MYPSLQDIGIPGCKLGGSARLSESGKVLAFSHQNMEAIHESSVAGDGDEGSWNSVSARDLTFTQGLRNSWIPAAARLNRELLLIDRRPRGVCVLSLGAQRPIANMNTSNRIGPQSLIQGSMLRQMTRILSLLRNITAITAFTGTNIPPNTTMTTIPTITTITL